MRAVGQHTTVLVFSHTRGLGICKDYYKKKKSYHWFHIANKGKSFQTGMSGKKLQGTQVKIHT
jgi:hypothetical protein